MQAGTPKVEARATLCRQLLHACKRSDDSYSAATGLLGAGFLVGRSRFAFEGRADAALDDAVADADELEDRAGAGIAQARLGQPQDAGVAARPIDEPRGDFGEQHAHGLLVAEQLQAAAAGGDGRRDRPAFHFAQRSLLRHVFQASLPRSAVGAELAGRVFGRQAAAGERDALLDQRPDFLGLGDVVMMRPLTLGLLSSNSASRSVRNSALARLCSRAR